MLQCSIRPTGPLYMAALLLPRNLFRVDGPLHVIIFWRLYRKATKERLRYIFLPLVGSLAGQSYNGLTITLDPSRQIPQCFNGGLPRPRSRLFPPCSAIRTTEPSVTGVARCTHVGVSGTAKPVALAMRREGAPSSTVSPSRQSHFVEK